MRAVGLLLFLLVPVVFGQPTLLPVPEPPVADMEPAVREQLLETMADLASLLEEGGEREISNLPRAEVFGEAGRLFLAYDLVDSAEACFENARRLSPEDFRWPYLLGAVWSNERRVDDALPMLQRALELRPEDLAARMRLGEVHLARNDPKAARESFEQALAGAPGTAAAHAGLARAAAALGQFELAVEQYRKALELEPGASSLRYPLAIALRETGRMEEARAELAQRGDVEVRFPDPLTRDLLQLTTGAGMQLMFGHRALKGGDTDLAIRRFRKALEVNPQSAEAHQALGTVLAQVGDLEGAVRHDSASLALRPENPTVHYNLGTVLIELGQVDQAIRHFRTTLDLVPNHDNARFNLATALAQGGRHREAVELFGELLEREPGDRATRFFAANSHFRLGRLTPASNLLDGLIAEEPSGLRSRLLRARVAVASGDGATARAQLQAVIAHPEALAEQRLAARRQLGDLEARAGNYLAAAEAYGAAVSVAPQEPGTQRALAMAWLLAERYDEADQALVRALEAVPQDLELNHLRARFLATCPDEDFRDGAAALELARRLFESRPRPDLAETVAMAYAELGRFEEAVGWQQRLLQEAKRAGMTGIRQRLESQLAAYQRGEAVRAPWRLP